MNWERDLFIPVDLENSRSTFRFTPTRSGTCMAGRLIPAFEFEVVPGDSIKMDLNALVKMSTPVYPTMDNLFMDVFFFFVPNSLVLSRRYGAPDINDGNTSWRAIIGAQDFHLNMPVPATGVRIPPIYICGDHPGLLGDYFNIDKNGDTLPVNSLPLLSYVAIWNENFRDPNVMDPVTWSYGVGSDGSVGVSVGFNGSVPLCIAKSEDFGSVLAAGAQYGVINALDYSSAVLTPVTSQDAETMFVFPTCRFHGYLGSALPWPQRNSVGVELPLGDKAPVVTRNELAQTGLSNYDLRWHSTTPGRDAGGLLLETGTVDPADGTAHTIGSAGTSSPGLAGLYPANLFADLSSATAANVNMLRLKIQQQRWFEKLARSGNRYDELKYGLFGVRGKDAGTDRPLYLGGKRIPLNIEMVASTEGGTTSGSAQGTASLGQLGAFSHTNDSDHYFYHSFDEWGTLMCLFTIRHHTTVDGFLKKMWLRQTRDDFYFPTFAHLGEQVVSKTEVTGDLAHYSTTFGYQQAWQEYRTEPDLCCGLLKYGRSLGFMTYVESFYSVSGLAEYLNASYQIKSIDQTLAVASYTSGFQFVYQFNFDFTARRCLPVYSIPGLMDHF